MMRFIPAWTIAAACALVVSVSAQDTTTKSKTKISADDAKVVALTGCLSQSSDGSTFMLTGATLVSGEGMKSKTKTKTDVDRDDVQVQSKTKTKIDDVAVGTSGVAAYELTPKEGVNLAPHVGHKVEITAVALDAATGSDDDAKVTIRNRTKIKRDDAPDARVESKTKAELPRGANARLTVVSVKHIAPSCTM